MNNKIYPVPRIKSEENKRWEFVLNELEKKIDWQVWISQEYLQNKANEIYKTAFESKIQKP